MKKNLVIVAAGEDSLHTRWVSDDNNFDIVVLYYGDSQNKFEEFKNRVKDCLKVKGHKWHLIANYLLANLKNIADYEYIWFPDDDLLSNGKDINRLFEICKTNNLWLCQPSVDGYVSHEIQKSVPNSLIRYTNFVEVLCPMMSLQTMLKLFFTFDINESAWGLDYLWPKILQYPKNKIAIIDLITVTHTRPLGLNYKQRFQKEPMQEFNEITELYNISLTQQVYAQVNI